MVKGSRADNDHMKLFKASSEATSASGLFDVDLWKHWPEGGAIFTDGHQNKTA